jgi:hypothetical protein
MPELVAVMKMLPEASPVDKRKSQTVAVGEPLYDLAGLSASPSLQAMGVDNVYGSFAWSIRCENPAIEAERTKSGRCRGPSASAARMTQSQK